jgi:hypothetical protein
MPKSRESKHQLEYNKLLGEGKPLVDLTLAQYNFSLLSKAQHLQLYPLQSFNPLIVATLIVLNVHGHQSARGAPCTFISSFLYGIFLHTLFVGPETPTIQTGDRNKFPSLDSPYDSYLGRCTPGRRPIAFSSRRSPCRTGHYTSIFSDPGLFIYPATAGKYMEIYRTMTP